MPGAEVVQPRPIVDPGRDLQEQREILNAKGQGAVRTAEIEAAVLAKLAFAVPTGMAPALQLGWTTRTWAGSRPEPSSHSKAWPASIRSSVGSGGGGAPSAAQN